MASERLVEEAGEAIRAEMARYGYNVHITVRGEEIARVLAAAALAVFEAAQAPTGDEREELIGLQLASYSKRMSDGYTSSIIRSNEEAAEIVLDAGFRLPVQGEPTDAQEVEFPFTHEGVTLEEDDGGVWVTVGASEFTTGEHRPYWIGPRALAALRAAGGVQGSAKPSGNSVEGERWRAAALAVQEEGEWEYGHECDESREAYPEERPAINDWPVTPDCQNAVVYRRTKAVPAGEWLPVEQEDNR